MKTVLLSSGQGKEQRIQDSTTGEPSNQLLLPSRAIKLKEERGCFNFPFPLALYLSQTQVSLRHLLAWLEVMPCYQMILPFAVNYTE